MGLLIFADRQKAATPDWVRLCVKFLVAGVGFEHYRLQVMSPDEATGCSIPRRVPMSMYWLINFHRQEKIRYLEVLLGFGGDLLSQRLTTQVTIGAGGG